MPRGTEDNQRAAYDFLVDHARSQTPFTREQLAAAVPGWSGDTARTYLSKHYADYLETLGDKNFRIVPEFKRLTFADFQELATQVKRVVAIYDRSTFEQVVVFDFLLPLTREDKLRRALDELFYRDTLERRLREIGLEDVAKIVGRDAGEDDASYVTKVINIIDRRIGGFSISHVSGRFRIGPIITRKESGDLLAAEKPYLIDETTAVVRFIIPCFASKISHDGAFLVGPESPLDPSAIEEEVRQIRGLFFAVFVEAVVPTIRGEELIWMLETSPKGQRLYELTRVHRGSAAE